MIRRVIAAAVWILGCAQPAPTGSARTDGPGAPPPNELALGAFPVAVSAPGLSASADPRDPRSIVVRGQCEVRITDITGAPDASGQRARERLVARGATFSNEAISSARWALVYQLPSAPPVHGVELGLVTEGRTFVCRAEPGDQPTQVCAVLICATLHPR